MLMFCVQYKKLDTNVEYVFPNTCKQVNVSRCSHLPQAPPPRTRPTRLTFGTRTTIPRGPTQAARTSFLSHTRTKTTVPVTAPNFHVANRPTLHRRPGFAFLSYPTPLPQVSQARPMMGASGGLIMTRLGKRGLAEIPDGISHTSSKVLVHSTIRTRRAAGAVIAARLPSRASVQSYRHRITVQPSPPRNLPPFLHRGVRQNRRHHPPQFLPRLPPRKIHPYQSSPHRTRRSPASQARSRLSRHQRLIGRHHSQANRHRFQARLHLCHHRSRAASLLRVPRYLASRAATRRSILRYPTGHHPSPASPPHLISARICMKVIGREFDTSQLAQLGTQQLTVWPDRRCTVRRGLTAQPGQ